MFSLSVRSFLKRFIDNVKMKTSHNNFNLNISSIKNYIHIYILSLILLLLLSCFSCVGLCATP